MAAPRFAPNDAPGPYDDRFYASPDVVPDPWHPDRPGSIEALQPHGKSLGAQGPDQGFALRIASRLAPDLHVSDGERLDDAVRGCLGIALRRASIFSRAPVVHDLRIAFTIWGYFDADPPAELVELRSRLFEGVGNVNHHYAEARHIADLVPESTLRMTPDQVAQLYPARWQSLTGATSG